MLMNASRLYFDQREDLLDKLENVCPIGKFLIEERTQENQAKSNYNVIFVMFSKNSIIESRYILGEYNPLIFIKDDRIIVSYSLKLT